MSQQPHGRSSRGMLLQMVRERRRSYFIQRHPLSWSCAEILGDRISTREFGGTSFKLFQDPCGDTGSIQVQWQLGIWITCFGKRSRLECRGVFGSSNTAPGPKSNTSQCRQGNASLGKNRAVFKENDQCTGRKRGSTCEGSRFVTGRGKE
ncbi:uncharacterized protein ACBT57_019159 [Dama dama]